MIKDVLGKYQVFVNLMNPSTVTGSSIKGLADLAKVKLTKESCDFIADLIKSKASNRKGSSMIDILTDPEISNAVETLLADVGSQGQEAESTSDRLASIHLDSSLVCSHCKKRLHLETVISEMKAAEEQRNLSLSE